AHMINLLKLCLFGYFLTFGCVGKKETYEIYSTSNLEIQQVAKHVYLHTSFLSTESFGNVPCNGMSVTNQDEAIIFGSPAESPAAIELIHWVEDHLGHRIKGVVATHFHADCLGGLEEFHKRSIPSYAHNV